MINETLDDLLQEFRMVDNGDDTFAAVAPFLEFNPQSNKVALSCGRQFFDSSLQDDARLDIFFNSRLR